MTVIETYKLIVLEIKINNVWGFHLLINSSGGRNTHGIKLFLWKMDKTFWFLAFSDISWSYVVNFLFDILYDWEYLIETFDCSIAEIGSLWMTVLMIIAKGYLYKLYWVTWQQFLWVTYINEINLILFEWNYSNIDFVLKLEGILWFFFIV